MKHRSPQLARAILTISIVLLAGCGGPLGPFGGGKLSGDEHKRSVDSWAFAADIEVIQLETNPSDPESINIWLGVVDDKLYLPSSLILGEENPAQRGWVKNVLADPHVRLRINDTVYPATAVRVTDPELEERIKSQMLKKYGEESTAQSDAAWIFRIDG
jgi:hypothetical protein